MNDDVQDWLELCIEVKDQKKRLTALLYTSNPSTDIASEDIMADNARVSGRGTESGLTGMVGRGGDAAKRAIPKSQRRSGRRMHRQVGISHQKGYACVLVP